MVALSVRLLVSPADSYLPTLTLQGTELSLAGAGISAVIGTLVLGWNRQGTDLREVLLLAGLAVLGSLPLKYVLPMTMAVATLLGWTMHVRGRTVVR